MNFMRYMGIELDFAQLQPTKNLLVDFRDYGPTDRTLDDLRNKYENKFGKDLIWRFPLSDGCHFGAVIIPVQEGFLCLPFNEVDADDNAIYLTEKTHLMTGEAFDDFCDDLRRYAQEFCAAMQEAKAYIVQR